MSQTWPNLSKMKSDFITAHMLASYSPTALRQTDDLLPTSSLAKTLLCACYDAADAGVVGKKHVLAKDAGLVRGHIVKEFIERQE